MTNTVLQARPSTSKWMEARPGEQFCIRVSAADTKGIYSVVEIVSVPGDSTPLHLHHKEDEYMLVLEGTVRVACGDRTFDLVAGESAILPRGIAHAWGNRTASNIRMVFIATPGGCEEALRLISEGGDIDMVEFAKRFQVDVLGPAPF